MHSKVMRFLVDCSAVVGVILALLVSGLVGDAVENFGVGVLVFIIVLVVVEIGLASEGMKVEQAENLAKIAYNTERLLRLQEEGRPNKEYSTLSYAPPVNANNSRAVIPTSWKCESCGETNGADSRFCKNCGLKRMY